LHDIVGEEGEHLYYGGARLRILGVCYDLRHALMGDRDYEFVENGMDEEKRLKNISISAKRIANPNEEYFFLKHQVRKEVDRLNCCVEDLKVNLDYPEDIIW